MSLDALIAEARSNDVDWSRDRADRVFAQAARRHEIRRGRARALVFASAAAVVILFVLRGAASAPSPAAESISASEPLAVADSGDAGFGRD